VVEIIAAAPERRRRRQKLLSVALDFEGFAPRLHQLERGYRPEQKWHRSLLSLASERKFPGGSEVPRWPRADAAAIARVPAAANKNGNDVREISSVPDAPAGQNCERSHQ
jgi:hypothetical protein